MERAKTIDAPAYDYKAITPSDVTDEQPFRALWVGTQGDVAIVSASGNVVTFTAVVGQLDVGGVRINATNTTATGIVALY